MANLLDYFTAAEQADVIARGGVFDVSGKVQDAFDDAASKGLELIAEPGLYLVNDVTLGRNTTLRGPLVGRGPWMRLLGNDWLPDNRFGAIFSNMSTDKNTINGTATGERSIASTILGMGFMAPNNTTGSHVYLPDGSNAIVLEKNCMHGASYGLQTSGCTYDLVVHRNTFTNQAAACIRKMADGGVCVRITENNFRKARTGQALVLSQGGSGIEISWAVIGNIIAQFEAAGVAAFDVSGASIRGCTHMNNHYEANSGANAWCVYAKGDAWKFGGDVYDAGVKGIECDQLNNFEIGTSRFSGLSDVSIRVNASCSNGRIMPQTISSAGAIVNNSSTTSFI